MKGLESLEIHDDFLMCMLFIIDSQWITKTWVKSWRGLGYDTASHIAGKVPMIRRKKVHFSGKNMVGTAAVHTRELPDLTFFRINNCILVNWQNYAMKFPFPSESIRVSFGTAIFAELSQKLVQ